MEQIVAASDGINWTWYHWLEIKGDVARQVRADRWHKYEDRGGEEEPKTLYRIEFFRAPKDRPAEGPFGPTEWPESVHKNWQRTCQRALGRTVENLVRVTEGEIARWFELK